MSPPASIDLQGGVHLRCGPTSAGLLSQLELHANVAFRRPRDDNLTVPAPLMVLLHSVSGAQTGIYFADFNQTCRLSQSPHPPSQGPRWLGRARQDQHALFFGLKLHFVTYHKGNHGRENHPRQHRRQHRAG